MIIAVSEATVPKISVIVRKAYGAGLYAMGGPAFEPDCCIALPSASIAVMGPQAAINAVYYNQMQEIDGRGRAGAPRPSSCARSTSEDIDILKLAAELVIDAVIEPERAARRSSCAASRTQPQAARVARQAQLGDALSSARVGLGVSGGRRLSGAGGVGTPAARVCSSWKGRGRCRSAGIR